jgi:hypothetical protein
MAINSNELMARYLKSRVGSSVFRMKCAESLWRQAKASGGYGLALLMVFIASTILVGVSFQLVSTPATIAYMGTSSQDNLAARQVALVGLDATESDIRTKLNANQTITTSYRYPSSGSNNITIPSDPSNLVSSGVQVGSYYATIPQARGNTYLIKVTATVGGATVEYSRLMQANKVTTVVPSSYDCSVVENQVLAGNIASIASADLITWAQNNCMVKTASVTMQTPSAGSGSTSSCSTYTGSGTISFASLSACTYNVHGTYTTVQLHSSPSTTANSYLFSYPGAIASRAIHVPGNVGSQAGIKASNSTGTPSTVPHTFYFNATNPAAAPEIYGGDGDDTMYLNGASTADIWTFDGANNVYISGTWGTSTNGSWLKLGETGDTGTNTVYINNLTNYPGQGATITAYSTGVSKIYFNSIGGDDIWIDTTSAADIIGCGVSFTGGTGTCGTFANGVGGMNTAAGNDIISLDAMLGSRWSVNAGSGNNIVYFKGCGGTSTDTTSVQAGSTTSLLIVGGNRSADCWVNGPGGSAVILKKSGITEGNSTSGYARTLTY